MRFAFAFVFAFAIGCTPEPTARKATVYDVGPVALVDAFRDESIGQRAYTGHRVRIHLEARDYEVHGKEVHFLMTPERPPAIIFELRTTLIDNHSPLLLEGICRGAIRDGKRRSSLVAYHVLVTDCSASH